MPTLRMNKDWILRKKAIYGNIAKTQAHSILSSYMVLLRESMVHGAILIGDVEEQVGEPSHGHI